MSDEKRPLHEVIAEIEAESIRDQANLHLDFARKAKGDNTFDGRPIENANALVAHAIIGVFEDNHRLRLESLPKQARRELVDVTAAIIEQAQVLGIEQSIYEKLRIPEPSNDENEDTDDARVATLVEEVEHFHSIAEVWAAKPDLTTLEACHGVAREAYGVRFSGQVPQPAPVGKFNPEKVYDKVYDIQHEDQIKTRSMRSAKELFGK